MNPRAADDTGISSPTTKRQRALPSSSTECVPLGRVAQQRGADDSAEMAACGGDRRVRGVPEVRTGCRFDGKGNGRGVCGEFRPDQQIAIPPEGVCVGSIRPHAKRRRRAHTDAMSLTRGSELIHPMRWLDADSEAVGGPRESGWAVYRLWWSCGCGYVGITSQSVERRMGQHLGVVDMRGGPILPRRMIAERMVLRMGRSGVIHHAATLGGTIEVVAAGLGEREARELERVLIGELSCPLNVADADGRTIERCDEAQYDKQIARFDADEVEAAYSLKRSVETWAVLKVGARLHAEAAAAFRASGVCDLAAELLERRYQLPDGVGSLADVTERYSAEIRVADRFATLLATKSGASGTHDTDRLRDAVGSFTAANSAARHAIARHEDLRAQLRKAEDRLLETENPDASVVVNYRAALLRSNDAGLHANSIVDAYVTSTAELACELGIAAASLFEAATRMLDAREMFDNAEWLGNSSANLYVWAAKEMLDIDVDPENWRCPADEKLQDAASTCADASNMVASAADRLREAARRHVDGLDNATKAVTESHQEAVTSTCDTDAAAAVRDAALLYSDAGAALRKAAASLRPVDLQADSDTPEEPW